jgi:ketosteroid isomerase-like protein
MNSSRSGVLHSYVDAWLRGDHPAMFAMYADDIVVHYGGTSPYAGVHRGRDEFLQVLVESSIRSQRSLVTINAVFDAETEGAIFSTESLVVDGETRTVERALRFRLAHGQIQECWLFDHDQHVVDAAWSGT